MFVSFEPYSLKLQRPMALNWVAVSELNIGHYHKEALLFIIYQLCGNLA